MLLAILGFSSSAVDEEVSPDSLNVELVTSVIDEGIVRDNLNVDLSPSVTDDSVPTDEPCDDADYDETDESGIIREQLSERVTSGTSAPTLYWNIASSGTYYGEFSALQAGLYTNYYFDCDADGILKYSYTAYTYGGNTNLTIKCYDMTAKKYVTSYTTGTINTTEVSEKRTISGLTAGHTYYLYLGNETTNYKLYGTINVYY